MKIQIPSRSMFSTKTTYNFTEGNRAKRKKIWCEKRNSKYHDRLQAEVSYFLECINMNTKPNDNKAILPEMTIVSSVFQRGCSLAQESPFFSESSFLS